MASAITLVTVHVIFSLFPFWPHRTSAHWASEEMNGTHPMSSSVIGYRNGASNNIAFFAHFLGRGASRPLLRSVDIRTKRSNLSVLIDRWLRWDECTEWPREMSPRRGLMKFSCTKQNETRIQFMQIAIRAKPFVWFTIFTLCRRNASRERERERSERGKKISEKNVAGFKWIRSLWCN